MADKRKVAFVTGASSGIGRAAAEAFVRAGWATVLADREDGTAVARELGAHGECVFISCDVTDNAGVEAAVVQAVERYGNLSAAFNAAGINGEQGRATADCTPENWQRVLAVDLTGVWHCMRHQIPSMLAGGGGSIVNCASVAGVVGAPFVPAYVAAKHGVVGLTRAAALEYGRQGVRVNAVCPGMIDTETARRFMTPEVSAALVEQSPMGRLGLPEEIAQAVLWLCDSASFVNGQALSVDGGWTSF